VSLYQPACALEGLIWVLISELFEMSNFYSAHFPSKIVSSLTFLLHHVDLKQRFSCQQGLNWKGSFKFQKRASSRFHRPVPGPGTAVTWINCCFPCCFSNFLSEPSSSSFVVLTFSSLLTDLWCCSSSVNSIWC